MSDITDFSNPQLASKKAMEYIGKELYLSTRKGKKYMVQNPDGKWIHFGAMNYKDFTKTNDDKKRNSYLARATKIKGNWKDDPYSPNNLSMRILWNWNGENTI